MSNVPPHKSDRYHRQIILPAIGEGGQQRLADSHALLVGCGALGTVVADALVRAGVGTLTIVDRDIVEITNLQRQTLFDESDANHGRPKALAARDRLIQINSNVRVRAIVDDFTPENAEDITADVPDAPPVGVVLDGTDNFETRYLLNDLAVSLGIPYVYAGAVGTTGMTFTVVPNVTPCLRCVFPEAPPPGTTPTCDTAGVLGPAVGAIANVEAAEAIKVFTGADDALNRHLLRIDVWTNDVQRIDLSKARRDDCPCCGLGEFEFLEGERAAETRTLCGRNSVQITPAASSVSVDLAELANRLAPHGAFEIADDLLRGDLENERGSNGDPLRLSVFASGRAIVTGTTDQDAARGIYAKYVGV